MDIKRMHEAIECLSEWLLREYQSGPECWNIAACGMVTDQLKDLSEAMKNRVEQKIFEEELCEMLKEKDEMEHHPERAGYDNWRYSSGRFAPTGHGHRSGYPMNPMHGNVRFYTQPEEADRGYDYDEYQMRRHAGRDIYPSKYGAGYDAYQMAKRHYHETKDEQHRKEMNERIDETVMDSIDVIREMMKDANPEVKKKLKEQITKFAEEVGKA